MKDYIWNEKGELIKRENNWTKNWRIGKRIKEH
jgi:hypothetical protein